MLFLNILSYYFLSINLYNLRYTHMFVDLRKCDYIVDKLKEYFY